MAIGDQQLLHAPQLTDVGAPGESGNGSSVYSTAASSSSTGLTPALTSPRVPRPATDEHDVVYRPPSDNEVALALGHQEIRKKSGKVTLESDAGSSSE